MSPRVTVLVLACNDEPYLGAAIESVLAQTFTDFDLLVVDDASTDGSRAVVERYRDPRIRLLVNPVNVGAGASRNRGLAAAPTEYVLHLDGNDVCFPERVARQVRHLDEHPDVAVVGSRGVLIDTAGRTIGDVWRPVTELGIRWAGIFQSPVIQSSAAMRRSVVWDELGGYEESRFGDDFDLWYRVARKHVIHNLPEALVAYRVDLGSLSTAERHPAREGYFARKAPKILESLRTTLHSDEFTPAAVENWLSLDDVRAAAAMVERAAARFAEVQGLDHDVVTHQTTMLARVLRKASTADRPFAIRLWAKIWRRHRGIALRALPRTGFTFVFGETPLRLRRAFLRRRATSGQPVRERSSD